MIEAFGLALLEAPEEGSPEPGLPGRELIAIRATDSGRTHHAPQPRARSEQERCGPVARRLHGRRHTACATAPHEHLHRIDGCSHGGAADKLKPSLPGKRR